MPKPDLSELVNLIPSRAIAILEDHGASIDELADMDVEQLEAIKGIGPKWAADIYESLSLLRTAPAADETLVPGYFASFQEEDAAAAEPEPDPNPPPPTSADIPSDESPLEMAFRYLRECGRDADAEVLAGKVERDGESAVLETAIAILEGLPGGALPKNLAQDVRERAGIFNH